MFEADDAVHLHLMASSLRYSQMTLILGQRILVSPGLMSNFTSSSLTYLSVIGAEVEGFGVDGSEAILGLVLEMVVV